MPLQFRPPFEIKPAKTKEEALAETVGPTIQNLPLLYMQYKQQKAENQLKLEEMEFKRKEMQSKYGTGVTAPTALTAGQVTEGGVAGGTAIETPEQLIERIGTEKYKAAKEKKYILIDRDPTTGNITQSEMPEGWTPTLAPKQPTEHGSAIADVKATAEKRQSEQALRKDYQQNNKKYVDAVLGYQKSIKLLSRKESVADTQLTFELAKAAAGGGMLSDQERQQFSQGLGNVNERIAAKYFGVTVGTKFTDAMRQQVRNVLDSNYAEVLKLKNSLKSQYSDIATRKGFNTADIIVDPSDVYDAPGDNVAGAAGPFSDPDKEKRYQEWKAKQASK